MLLDKTILKTGAKIYHAYNGAEAIEILRVNKCLINIAIVDLLMPMYHGYEVVEMMAPSCPDTIFVAYSADIFRLKSERCENAGFAKFFSKPILPYKLLAELDNLLLVKRGYNNSISFSS